MMATYTAAKTRYDTLQVGDRLKMIYRGYPANEDYSDNIVEIQQIKGAGWLMIKVLSGKMMGSVVSWDLSSGAWDCELINEWDK